MGKYRIHHNSLFYRALVTISGHQNSDEVAVLNFIYKYYTIIYTMNEVYKRISKTLIPYALYAIRL